MGHREKGEEPGQLPLNRGVATSNKVPVAAWDALPGRDSLAHGGCRRFLRLAIGPLRTAPSRRLGLPARNDESGEVTEPCRPTGPLFCSIALAPALVDVVGHGSPLGPDPPPAAASYW
jgi:hypothetical protein